MDFWIVFYDLYFLLVQVVELSPDGLLAYSSLVQQAGGVTAATMIASVQPCPDGGPGRLAISWGAWAAWFLIAWCRFLM
jgi:hypothetical protein